MNVLITGASNGIGYELARCFVAEGHRVIATARSAGRLEVLEQQCIDENASSGLHTFVFDLEDLPGIESKLMKFTAEHFEVIDILINNAGYLVRDKFEDIDAGEVDRILRVNYTAPARLIALALPLLRRSEKPHVINIGSMGGFHGSKKFPGLSHYSSSKAAISILTECLAAEYADTPVRFNCLSLGAVQTEMLAEAFPGFTAPRSAQEMASFIIDFAVRAYDFFNGKVLPVALGNP